MLRFAAVRTLSKVAQTHPMAVTNCNIDMETLITDQNRSIATLAITTLLKTGNESSVDRLLKQISGFMSEIADEFKIVVVDAIRTLCLKFPQKYRGLLNFLSNVLREDGGFDYKKSIVDSILILIREIPDAKEIGLAHLCEFIEVGLHFPTDCRACLCVVLGSVSLLRIYIDVHIFYEAIFIVTFSCPYFLLLPMVWQPTTSPDQSQDCEFTYLSVQILHLLGEEGPKTKEPSKCIRYIYNRVILENATIRAAAVATLAKFAMHVADLRDRVLVLLRRALFDNDDEVR